MEEAIKSAQIFDDTLEKPHSNKNPPARTNVSTPNPKFNNNGHKRKDVGGSSGDPKKQKVRKGKLTSEELARARREKLCFRCLGKHEQKDCPLKLGNESDKGGGAEKAMHCVQVLALPECPKFLAVEVSHNSCEHDCQLTTSPWQVGPHELFRLHGTINGRRVRILVDDGATHNFLNYTLVKKLRLQQESSKHKYVVSLMNGNDCDVWDTIVKGVTLEMQSYSTTMDFQVMNMTRADVVLGREWLYGLGTTLSRSYAHNTISFRDSAGAHVLLIGEREVPASPLVCSAELQSLLTNNEIEEIFSCYCLPTVSHVLQCCINNNSIEDCNCKKECNAAQPMLSNITLQSPTLASDSHNNVHEDALAQLRTEFSDVFPTELPKGLPPDRGITHGIDLVTGAKPLSKPAYRLSVNKAREVERQLAELVQ